MPLCVLCFAHDLRLIVPLDSCRYGRSICRCIQTRLDHMISACPVQTQGQPLWLNGNSHLMD